MNMHASRSSRIERPRGGAAKAAIGVGALVALGAAVGALAALQWGSPSPLPRPVAASADFESAMPEAVEVYSPAAGEGAALGDAEVPSLHDQQQAELAAHGG